MKLPESTKIGLYDYGIEVVENLTSDDGDRLWGQCAPGDLKIRLDSNVHRDKRPEVLLHETLHALLDESGISYSFTRGDMKEVDPRNIVEGLVHNLTPHLLTFIRENPQMIKYLQKGG